MVEALFRLGTAPDSSVAGKCYIINDPLSWSEFSIKVADVLGIKTVQRIPSYFAFPIALIGSAINKCGATFPLTLNRYKALTATAVFR